MSVAIATRAEIVAILFQADSNTCKGCRATLDRGSLDEGDEICLACRIELAVGSRCPICYKTLPEPYILNYPERATCPHCGKNMRDARVQWKEAHEHRL